MLKMIIIDDEYLVRKGLQTTIDWQTLGIEIVAEATDGEEGLELIMTLHPDIVITDIRMPNMDGIELMEQIRIRELNVAIIVLSGFDEFNFAKKAIENGAMAYLLKPIDNQELYETMKKITRKILEQNSTQNYFSKLQEELTSLKKQFIVDMLKGSLTDLEKIRDKIKFLELPLDLQNQIVLVLQMDHHNVLLQNTPQATIDQLRCEIEIHISKHLLLSSHYYGLFVSTSSDQWTIVLQCVHEGTSSILEQLKTACHHFFDEMSGVSESTYSIGISKLTTSITALNEQYKNACLAAQNKLLAGKSSLTLYSDLLSTDFRKEIRDAMTYVKEHYHQNIAIKDAADALHLSASHLMHLFKSEVDVTFNDYLTSYRIKVAEELLSRGEHKIYEISNMTGYTDVKYFSQLFKKVTGYTPREYKNF
ncbi:MAG: response regulator [Vallitaleaceae bacterium]|nr:response regulator [Vallitaleaceae bacterium]